MMTNPILARGQFFGHTVKSQTVADFGLTETNYPRDFRIGMHSHESAYLGFILRGSYVEQYDRKTRECLPWMLVFHPAGEIHSQYFQHSKGDLFRVEIGGRMLARLKEHGGALHDPFAYQRHPVCHLAARLHAEFRDTNDPISAIVIEGLALEILGEISRLSIEPLPRRPPRWLVEAREMIHDLACQRLSLSQVAQTAGVHPIYLAREFRRFTGCSVGEYIRARRIEIACCRIIESKESLAEIAIACGFYDQSHFSKAFRLIMNTTPAQYRARCEPLVRDGKMVKDEFDPLPAGFDAHPPSQAD
jgi:AraC family transcriptional regulator